MLKATLKRLWYSLPQPVQAEDRLIHDAQAYWSDPNAPQSSSDFALEKPLNNA